MQARILVTDDDKHVRYVLAKYIRRLGYTVVEAASGEEALRILSEAGQPPIDLMLTDIWMPHMTGVDLLEAVRRIDADLPIAMITGSATIDSSIAALNAGAYAYLKKPIQNKQLRDILARGLSRRKEMQEYQAARQQLLERYQELEQRLEAMQEMTSLTSSAAPNDLLAELIRGLRHELGNATTAIKLNLAVLEEEGNNPANLQEHLRDLQASTDHLVDLLGKLREYPRHRLAMEVIDVHHVLLSIEDLAKNQGRPFRARLQYKLPQRDILIQAAPLELGRALTHIVQNAIEASTEAESTNGEPVIEISAVADEEAVVITISDQGPGFPTEMLEKPFSPGYTTKATGGVLRGLGMGLFMARATVDLHGGRIWLENRPEGGASVHVRLPLAHVPENSTEPLHETH
jgi:signal transduction histidine kinase